MTMLRGERARQEELLEKYKTALDAMEISDRYMVAGRLLVRGKVPDSATRMEVLARLARIDERFEDEIILHTDTPTAQAVDPAVPERPPDPIYQPSPPSAPAEPAPTPVPLGFMSYQVQPGDTLESIAQLYYADQSKSQLIWGANQDKLLEGRHGALHPGTILNIP